MKRDMELILKILQQLEERDEVSIIERMEVAGYDDNVVSYHVRRMYEAGLLDAEAVISSTTHTRLINVLPFGITWEGHEFLDSMRDKKVANTVRKRLGNKLSEVPFKLIQELALSVGRGEIGLEP